MEDAPWAVWQGASENSGEISQLACQEVRLPFPEELLGAASPANVEYA